MPEPTDYAGPGSLAPDDGISALLKRLERAKAARQPWEGVWTECYDYMLPQRGGFHSVSPGRTKMEHIFDETALISIQEFASAMSRGLYNQTQFYRLMPGAEVINQGERRRMQRDLDEVTRFQHELIRLSNFSTQLDEVLIDIAIGTGHMAIERSSDAVPFYFTAVPQHEIWIDQGPFGGVDGVFLIRELRAADLPTRYPRGDLNEELKRKVTQQPDEKIEILEATYRDWGNRGTETFIHCVVAVKAKHKLEQKTISGFGSRPWVNPRWSASARELYGRGPALSALPATKTVNLTMQLILENAELAVAGVYQADTDSDYNVDTIELLPGTILPRHPDSRGLEPVERAGSFDVSQIILDDQRANIRRAFYNQEIGNLQRTPRSATEVDERSADLFRRMSSPVTRLWHELMVPVVRRITYILRQEGFIDMPPIDGRKIAIEPRGPFAKAQRFDEVFERSRFYTTLAQTFGPEMLSVVVNPHEAASDMAALYGLPERLVRQPEEVEAGLQQLMAQQGGVPGLPPGGG